MTLQKNFSSPFAFGGAALGGTGGGYSLGLISEEDTWVLLDFLRDHGVSVLDLAPIYGFGEAERRVGKYFQRYPEKRKDFFILTKGGIDWDQNKRVDLSNHPETIKKMIEQSLTRLQTEVIDLYMIHWPDPRHDILGAMEVLKEAQQKGQIRFLGLSNPDVTDVEKIQSRWPGLISSLQMESSIFQTKHLDQWQPWLEKNQACCFTWGTFDKGLFSEKIYDEKRTYSPQDSRASKAIWWKQDRGKREIRKQFLLTIDPLIKKQFSWNLSDLAVLYSLSHHLCIPLMGTYRIEEWKRLFDLDHQMKQEKSFSSRWESCQQIIQEQKVLFFDQHQENIKKVDPDGSLQQFFSK